MSTSVRDNPDEGQYEIREDGALAAFTVYQLRGPVIEFMHTETEPGFEGRGLARELVSETLDDVRRRGLQVRPFCPYVRSFMVKHPEYRDLVPEAERASFGLVDQPA